MTRQIRMKNWIKKKGEIKKREKREPEERDGRERARSFFSSARTFYKETAVPTGPARRHKTCRLPSAIRGRHASSLSTIGASDPAETSRIPDFRIAPSNSNFVSGLTTHEVLSQFLMHVFVFLQKGLTPSVPPSLRPSVPPSLLHSVSPSLCQSVSAPPSSSRMNRIPLIDMGSILTHRYRHESCFLFLIFPAFD